MTLDKTLLPPNATSLERAIETATARLGDVSAPIDTLFDPATIKAGWLPWLAWGLSVDRWESDWSEATKRYAVASSIADHRIKGTRLSVDAVLASMDVLARVVEWHEANPRRAPHTFDVVLPLVAADGVAPDARRASAAFADAIVREVARVKPLREHFQLVQLLRLGAPIEPVAAGRAASFSRTDVAITVDTDPIWARLLQTEDGEPLEDDTGDNLENA